LPRWTNHPKLHHETTWPLLLSRPLRRLPQTNGIFQQAQRFNRAGNLGHIRRRQRLGGLLNYYRRAA
jgi:hypothetical protein